MVGIVWVLGVQRANIFPTLTSEQKAEYVLNMRTFFQEEEEEKNKDEEEREKGQQKTNSR